MNNIERINTTLLLALIDSGWVARSTAVAPDGTVAVIHHYRCGGGVVRRLGYSSRKSRWYVVSNDGRNTVSECSTAFALSRAIGTIDKSIAARLQKELVAEEASPKRRFKFKVNVNRNTMRQVGRAVAAGVIVGLSINYVRGMSR